MQQHDCDQRRHRRRRSRSRSRCRCRPRPRRLLPARQAAVPGCGGHSVTALAAALAARLHAVPVSQSGTTAGGGSMVRAIRARNEPAVNNERTVFTYANATSNKAKAQLPPIAGHWAGRCTQGSQQYPQQGQTGAAGRRLPGAAVLAERSKAAYLVAGIPATQQVIQRAQGRAWDCMLHLPTGANQLAYKPCRPPSLHALKPKPALQYF